LIILYLIILYCIVLYYIILYYIRLDYIILYYTILYLYCILLYCIVRVRGLSHATFGVRHGSNKKAGVPWVCPQKLSHAMSGR